MEIQLGTTGGSMLFNPFMFGFDGTSNVDSEKYRCYVAIICALREILDECKINIGCKGYIYIQDCVITIFDQRRMNICFKSDVYPYVAAKYGIRDIENIEHNIRNAIGAAYKLCLSDICQGSGIGKYFDKRPTNKEFLLRLTREVYRRVWNESVEFARF
jgi:hypothetical protein